MASTPPGPKKQKIEYIIDKGIYDQFMKACSHKGFAPQVIIERAMRRFTETGQM